MIDPARRAAAARALVECSVLGRHPYFAAHCSAGDNHYQWDALDNYSWSHGEAVLIEVLRTLVLGHGNVELDQLWALDEQNRAAAVLSIRLAMVEQDDPIGVWE